MLDPFAGVGTIPFEAALRGHTSYAFVLGGAFVVIEAKLRVTATTGTSDAIGDLEYGPLVPRVAEQSRAVARL